MTDFSRRNYRGGTPFAGLQNDVERTVGNLRKDMTGSGIPFESDGISFADPQPTTVGEAIRRIAAAVAAGASGPIAE